MRIAVAVAVAAVFLGIAVSAQKPDTPAPAPKDKPAAEAPPTPPGPTLFLPPAAARRPAVRRVPDPAPVPIRYTIQQIIDTPIPAPWQPPARKWESGR